MSTYGSGDREKLSRFYREHVEPLLTVDIVFSGVNFIRRRGRQWSAPCPLHNGRGPNFRVNHETLEWKCWTNCGDDGWGDAIGFVMQSRQLSFREAVFELAENVGANTSDFNSPRQSSASPQPKPVRSRPPTESTREAPAFPLGDELATYWSKCVRADAVHDVRRWLGEDRRINATAVADIDLARAAPDGISPTPGWSGYGGKDGRPFRSWPSQRLQLVVPLYDQHAAMKTVLFRRVFESADKGSFPPKSASATGGRQGLGMACPLARTLLASGRWPEWWPADVKRGVIVGEGEMDFLTFVTEFSDANETAPAVIGGFAGGWFLPRFLPSGTTLVIRTHADKKGADYANEIIESVTPRWRAGELFVNLPVYYEWQGKSVALK